MEISQTKTLFISSFFGLIARNILATDFLKVLAAKDDLRIIIFAPQEKKYLYQETFSSSNVTVEGMPNREASRFELWVDSIFLNASDTSARRIHRLIERRRDGRYVRFIGYGLLAKLSIFAFSRKLLRWLAYKLPLSSGWGEYFEKYKPDLVFATDIFEPNDIFMIREAQRRSIFVLGMVRSWDNIVTKGLNRVITDKLVVNCPKIKEEAVKYCDFKPENIFVVGIPHYDDYIAETRISKEELFQSLGLDPKKKTVFFCPPSDIYAQGDPIAEKVVKLLQSLNVQIILRLYLVGKISLGNVKAVPGRLAIDDPGASSDFEQVDLIGKDAHLADLIYHSDVVIAFASTLAIDAAVFGKPIIFVGFDGSNNCPYWQSLLRFYDYDHQKSLLDTGGVVLAKTPQEFLWALDRYLVNPKLDVLGRARIINERCWKLDGRSGWRLARVVKRCLNR